MDVNCNTK